MSEQTKPVPFYESLYRANHARLRVAEKECAELREVAQETVQQWDKWLAYLHEIGVEPEARGIAPFVGALVRLRRLVG